MGLLRIHEWVGMSHVDLNFRVAVLIVVAMSIVFLATAGREHVGQFIKYCKDIWEGR